MPIELSSARAKIDHAERLLRSLEATLSDISQEPGFIEINFVDHPGGQRVSVTTKPIDEGVKQSVADIAHNLRVSLDHAASQIYTDKTGKKHPDYFPIAKTHDDLARSLSRSALVKVIPSFSDFITRDIDPTLEGRSWLYAINLIDRHEKHYHDALAVPAVSEIQFPYAKDGNGNTFKGMILKIAQGRSATPFGGSAPFVEFTPPIAKIEFHFGNIEVLHGYPLLESLKNMWSECRGAVAMLERWYSELPPE